jgi:hypothetical protein
MTTAEIMFAQPGDRTIDRKEEARKVLWALLAALFIHLVVAYTVAVLGGTFSPAFPVEEKPVELTLVDLREKLCDFPGVGAKVANCVMLFAYERPRACPIDVWIERVLKEKYFPRKRKVVPQRLRAFCESYFGEYGGYAQQYLFHHARTALHKSGAARDSSRLRHSYGAAGDSARNHKKRDVRTIKRRSGNKVKRAHLSAVPQ